MDWLLTASRESRIRFLRGVADSDGLVNIRNRTVEITTEPNTVFIKTLFTSLNVHARTYVSKGVGVVSITAPEAMKPRIFNPETEMHRGRLLQKLANAKTFPAQMARMAR